MDDQVKGKKMTTIKVSTETAAIISVAVRTLRAQGDKSVTADKLLKEVMSKIFPDVAQLIRKKDDDK